MSILVVGSVALDTLRFPGGIVHERVLGGAACYFSLVASLFSPVRLVGVIGGDFPKAHIDLLKSKKIDIAGLEIVPDGETFFWDGEYHLDMNDRTTHKTHLGVFGNFLPKLPAGWEKSEFVFCANIDPALQIRVLKACKKRRFAALDTMNFWIEHHNADLRKAINLVDLLFLNDSEAKLLTGKKSILEAAQTIRKMGPSHVVIKRGEYGVFMFGPKGPFAAPALPLTDVIDPTGAGDTFAGGFMGALAAAVRPNERALRLACVAGTVAASFTCQGIGVSRLVKLSKKEFTARARQFERLVQI